MSDLPVLPDKASRSKAEEDAKQGPRTAMTSRIAKDLQVETDNREDEEDEYSPEVLSEKEPAKLLVTASVAELKERLKALHDARLRKRKLRRRGKQKMSLLETMRVKQLGRDTALEALAKCKAKAQETKNEPLPSRRKAAKDDEDDKEKKNKNKKKDVSSSEDCSAGGGIFLFHEVLHSRNGLASNIMSLAKWRPGKLLDQTSKLMHNTLHPGKAVVGLPLILNHFLQQAWACGTQLEGQT